MNRHDAAFGLAVLLMVLSNAWMISQMRVVEQAVSARYDEWIEPLTSRLTIGTLWSEITTPRLSGEASYDWTVRHMEGVVALRDRYIERWGLPIIERYDVQAGNKPKEKK